MSLSQKRRLTDRQCHAGLASGKSSIGRSPRVCPVAARCMRASTSAETPCNITVTCVSLFLLSFTKLWQARTTHNWQLTWTGAPTLSRSTYIHCILLLCTSRTPRYAMGTWVRELHAETGWHLTSPIKGMASVPFRATKLGKYSAYCPKACCYDCVLGCQTKKQSVACISRTMSTRMSIHETWLLTIPSGCSVLGGGRLLRSTTVILNPMKNKQRWHRRCDSQMRTCAGSNGTCHTL